MYRLGHSANRARKRLLRLRPVEVEEVPRTSQYLKASPLLDDVAEHGCEAEQRPKVGGT